MFFPDEGYVDGLDFVSKLKNAILKMGSDIFENEEFLDLETSPASKMSSGEQNRVLTHRIERPTWLEELASESNTIQAQ